VSGKVLKMRPTMRDVARAAGVPVSAVPLVLGNRPGVSPERRARVQSAAHALGYKHPAGAARPTRRHRMGLVIETRGIPIFTDFYYGEILVGIQAEAKRLGLSVWLHTFDPDVERIEDVAASARDEVDGFIIVSGGDMTDERIAHLEQTGLPTVLVDNFLIGHNIHAIAADNIGAGFQATEHLLALGHRRIGMLVGPRTYRKFVHRHTGYMDALAAAGVAYDAALAPPLQPGDQQISEAQLRHLLALPREQRPTAIVCVNDRAAARALVQFHRLGLRVPHDMSVVGIGDVEEATATIPPLTTVAIPRREMGVMGVRRLVELLAGSAPAPFKMVLYTTLVERESATRAQPA
jgi:DNA-binding LacI/PurR family transcriptional regulator